MEPTQLRENLKHASKKSEEEFFKELERLDNYPQLSTDEKVAKAERAAVMKFAEFAGPSQQVYYQLKLHEEQRAAKEERLKLKRQKRKQMKEEKWAQRVRMLKEIVDLLSDDDSSEEN